VHVGGEDDLRWRAVLGSEIASDFKPKPQVYFASADDVQGTFGERW
jgi:hypothetical protein